MRRAAESELNVKFTLIDKDADIEKEINTFFDLMIQDPGKANFLHPAMREQMTAVLHAAFTNGYLWLGFLEIDGVKTAASLNFDYKINYGDTTLASAAVTWNFHRAGSC
ncbi:MAG: hypothetical protein HC797_01625 [Anaerolineales bacterium]|nr:hypothetical protein [Anaerolineales bacterium]